MGLTSLLLMSYFLIFLLIILIVSFILRIKKLEEKLLNFSVTEAYAIIKNLSEIVKESERLAEDLDSKIKEKEAILEDLVDLIDAKIVRLDSVISKSRDEKGLRQSIISLHEEGVESVEIARRLGISLTEVQITLNIINRG